MLNWYAWRFFQLSSHPYCYPSGRNRRRHSDKADEEMDEREKKVLSKGKGGVFLIWTIFVKFKTQEIQNWTSKKKISFDSFLLPLLIKVIGVNYLCSNVFFQRCCHFFAGVLPHFIIFTTKIFFWFCLVSINYIFC